MLAVEPAPMQPVQLGERVEIIDILRGFALLGILCVNMEFYTTPLMAAIVHEPYWGGLHDRMATLFIKTFCEGKFYILFSFLFGLGIGSSLGSAIARGTERPRVALGWCQMLLCGAMAWAALMLTTSLPFWPINPSITTSIWYNYQLDMVRCLWVVLPGAILWGASFPLALAAVAAPGQDPGRLVGGVYAAADYSRYAARGDTETRRTSYVRHVTRPEGISVSKEGSGWRVRGAPAERAVAMTDLDNEEAVGRLQRRLISLGVERELERAGARAGQGQDREAKSSRNQTSGRTGGTRRRHPCMH